MLPNPQDLPKSSFGEGLSASFRAMGYTLKNPTLLFYVFLAVLINGLLLGALLWYGWSYLDPMFLWLKQQSIGTGTWSWFARQMFNLGVVLKVLLGIAVAYFLIPTVFPIILNLNPLTAILLTRMFEVTFQKKTGGPLPQYYPFAKGMAISLWAEVRKLISSAFLFLFAFFFSFIPVVGTILGPVLFLVIGIQFAGWSYVTPYYEGLGYSYGEQRTAMRQQRMAIWGLGAIAMIPFLNIIALFTGCVGGALFSSEKHKAL